MERYDNGKAIERFAIYFAKTWQELRRVYDDTHLGFGKCCHIDGYNQGFSEALDATQNDVYNQGYNNGFMEGRASALKEIE